jgi:very-short-patch-repair endonuclease
LATAARALRRDATGAERRLWQALRRRQIGAFRFRRQVILGGFIADFACLEARLVVEVDGATHSSETEVGRDMKRTAVLATHGFTVLRFTNDDVFRNLDGVVETVAMKLAELRPRSEEILTERSA